VAFYGTSGIVHTPCGAAPVTNGLGLCQGAAVLYGCAAGSVDFDPELRKQWLYEMVSDGQKKAYFK